VVTGRFAFRYFVENGGPTGLNSTNITANSADLNWNSVAISSRYLIQYKKGLSGESWTTVKLTAPASTYHLSGLSSNTKYKWRIKSLCGTDKSGFSEIAKFSTHPQKENSEAITESPDLKIYPNPGDGNYTVETPVSGDALIYNVLGEVILTQRMIQGTNQIYIEKVPAGIYTLKFIGTGVQLKQIVKN